MSVFFDGAGFKAERMAVEQFGGNLTNLKKYQYADIDAFIPDRKGKVFPVSIKDQLYSSGKFGSIQVETLLTNTRNEASTQGCFYNCKAAVYFWLVWHPDYGESWLILSRKALTKYIEENSATLRTWCTKANTEAKNRSYGRYYDRAEGYTLNVREISKIGKIRPVERRSH
jgi:hypothetical protein